MVYLSAKLKSLKCKLEKDGKCFVERKSKKEGIIWSTKNEKWNNEGQIKYFAYTNRHNTTFKIYFRVKLEEKKQVDDNVKRWSGICLVGFTVKARNVANWRCTASKFICGNGEKVDEITSPSRLKHVLHVIWQSGQWCQDHMVVELAGKSYDLAWQLKKSHKSPL